jgi:hypothetical protein
MAREEPTIATLAMLGTRRCAQIRQPAPRIALLKELEPSTIALMVFRLLAMKSQSDL